MVLFFIAELALTVAFKFSTWCLGKTFDGIMYIVKRRNNDNNDSDDFVVISHQEYCSLKKTHELYLNYASSSTSSSSSSSSSCSSDAEDTSSTSK